MEIHGSKTSSWTHLAETAEMGATQITLWDSVNWKVGTTIVIGTTDYDYKEYQSETRNNILVEFKFILCIELFNLSLMMEKQLHLIHLCITCILGKFSKILFI